MAQLRSTRRFSLQFESLEDRLTPSSVAPDVDLTTRGALGTINQAIFRQFDAQPTGTGVIDSFVRLQSQGAKASVEHGFNTDGPLQFDENKSRQFTHALRLGDVPEVNIGGVKYREFLLDINQKSSQPYLSLDELRLYVGDAPDWTNYDLLNGTLAGHAPVYNLDEGGDHWVKLDVRLNPGSGKGDMLLYVPSSRFGIDPAAYVYLYSKFGLNYMPSAGFEEWAVAASSLTCDHASITGAVRDIDGNPMSDIVIFLDANDNGVLDANEQYATTDAAGQYAFTNLASGVGALSTYRVRQILPEGYVQLGDAPPPISFALCTDLAAVVDFINYFDEWVDSTPNT